MATPRPGATRSTATDSGGACPVSQIAPDLYLVTTRAEAVAVLGDDESFSGLHEGGPPASRRTLFQATPGDHAVRRRILAGAISTGRVASVAPYAHQRARTLVQAFVGQGQAELMADLATPLTGDVVGQMLGIAVTERPRIHHLVATMNRERLAAGHAADDGQPVTEASGAFAIWVRSEVDRRRREVLDDGLAALLATDPVTGYRLDDDEIVVHARNLCQAAQGSTRLLIGNLLYTLAREPDLYRRLARERSLVPVAIEESLRLDSPNRWAKRTCTRSVVLADQCIEPGQKVMVNLASVNRDGQQFPDGDRFELDRVPRPAHVAFGWGPHRCPGVAVARLVTSCALRAALDEIAEIRPAPEGAYEPQEDLNAFRWYGPQRLRVSFDPR